MVGNDIVDLAEAKKTSNWQRPGFLEKVFTQNEHELIFSSEGQHQMVWLLWSMKEAAYKVYVQQFGKRFFNPKRLECEFISEADGMVKVDDHLYVTKSIITEDYVYTIAKLSKIEKVNSSVFKTENTIYKIQSDVLKQSFMTLISERESIEIQDLEIKKTANGVPQLFTNFTQLPIDFSLTHCGRFSGFVYC